MGGSSYLERGGVQLLKGGPSNHGGHAPGNILEILIANGAF